MVALVKAKAAPFVGRRAGGSAADIALRLQETLQSAGLIHVACIGQSVVALHNNALEPTPATKARFVWFSSGAAQLKRWARKGGVAAS